mmetsp:Transcript_53644/g.99957  ORF Transcript_53644/g.99957 Transcript_53644/m.99957 type:complete len:527 (+) Transcript_53644:2358-3938(+)
MLALQNRHLLRHRQQAQKPKQKLLLLHGSSSRVCSSSRGGRSHFPVLLLAHDFLHCQPRHLLELCHVHRCAAHRGAASLQQALVPIQQTGRDAEAALRGDQPHCFALVASLPQHVDGVVEALEPHEAPGGPPLAVPALQAGPLGSVQLGRPLVVSRVHQAERRVFAQASLQASRRRLVKAVVHPLPPRPLRPQLRSSPPTAARVLFRRLLVLALPQQLLLLLLLPLGLVVAEVARIRTATAAATTATRSRHATAQVVVEVVFPVFEPPEPVFCNAFQQLCLGEFLEGGLPRLLEARHRRFVEPPARLLPLRLVVEVRPPRQPLVGAAARGHAGRGRGGRRGPEATPRAASVQNARRLANDVTQTAFREPSVRGLPPLHVKVHEPHVHPRPRHRAVQRFQLRLQNLVLLQVELQRPHPFRQPRHCAHCSGGRSGGGFFGFFLRSSGVDSRGFCRGGFLLRCCCRPFLSCCCCCRSAAAATAVFVCFTVLVLPGHRIKRHFCHRSGCRRLCCCISFPGCPKRVLVFEV